MIDKNDLIFMKEAIKLSKNCPPSYGAYSVGAVIVDKNNKIIATGYSRETADNMHAEEVAINKANLEKLCLEETVLYSTMEPCGLRLSGKKCCADIIIQTGIKKVVYGINEPIDLVQNPVGIIKLKNAGIDCEQIIEFHDEINQINKHIFK
jgi:pyrimidine deaminase RibD-like protein